MGNEECIFSYRTKKNSSPNGKPRVFFTCHPKDFEPNFKNICNDIFKTHDCVIYYTDDMMSDLSSDDIQIDMERMNLFVVPITIRLLTQPNRAMDSDVKFAIEKHISLLPIMIEPGLEEIYSRPDRFGELQFLNPYSDDLSEINYTEKLKQYLESVLISDELAQRVRKAFDAYIFLSYRKKDRTYANELMKLIHRNPEFRDIAIWFDEFLIPGESFKENIDKMLDNSDLFTLLVTPNLLEMPDGKPNYVMSEEYPAAKKAGKPILPTEMRPTNKEALRSSFNGIPECVDARDDLAFRKRLLDSINRVAITANRDEPEHNYLIGLAYLEGIDVELDINRGINLISLSAQRGLPEAMSKLYHMYFNGDKVSQDYWIALIWAEKLYEYLVKTEGEKSKESIYSLYNLAVVYSRINDFQNASTLFECAYNLQSECLGDMHSDTLRTLNDLANIYCKIGKIHKALELYEKVYKLCNKQIDDELFVIVVMEKLAKVYGMLGFVHEEQELYERAFELRQNTFGEDELFTIDRLEKLAKTFYKNGNALKAKELYEKLYELRRSSLGEEARLTIETIKDIAYTYYKIGNIHKAEELNIKAFELFCKAVDSGNHSKMMTKLMNDYYYPQNAWNMLERLEAQYNLSCERQGVDNHAAIEILKKIANLYHKMATAYHRQGDFCKALELYEKAYSLRYKTFGEYCLQTMTTLKKLAGTYCELGNTHRALVLYERAYKISIDVCGKNDRRTISVLKKMAAAYAEHGDYSKAQKLYEQSNELLRNIFESEKFQCSISTLKKKASIYLKLGDTYRAIGLYDEIYSRCCSSLGEEDPQTLTALNRLAVNYGLLGDYQKAKELREKVYVLRCKVLGEDSPDTMRTMYGLAIVYDALGEYHKEIELQEKLYDIQYKVFGKHHEKTLHTLQEIKELKERFGE